MTVHDEALAARVREALNSDKRIANLPIGIRVSNGEIFLKGSVDTFDQADAVKFIVSGIAGVRHVNTDEIGVKEAANE